MIKIYYQHLNVYLYHIIHFCDKDVNIDYNKKRKEVIQMEDLEEIARKIRNKKAQEWRDNNKDKVKEINKRYWLNKAKKELEKNNN